MRTGNWREELQGRGGRLLRFGGEIDAGRETQLILLFIRGGPRGTAAYIRTGEGWEKPHVLC